MALLSHVVSQQPSSVAQRIHCRYLPDIAFQDGIARNAVMILFMSFFTPVAWTEPKSASGDLYFVLNMVSKR